jgi:hypothetical protein
MFSHPMTHKEFLEALTEKEPVAAM